MNKILSISIIALAFIVSACTTNVVVDSTAHPIGSYDGMTGAFTGKISGNINSAFKATNIALENDMHLFRVGQKPGDNQWRIYARAELDIQVLVILKQESNNIIDIRIEYGDGDIIKSQQLFNYIAKNITNF